QASVMTEAAQKNCAFILYTRVSTGRSMTMKGKMSMIMPHKPSAADSPLPNASAEDLTSLPATEKAVVKAGDSITLEYRLYARGSEVASGKFEGKAQRDGDDVLGPLVSQLASRVVAEANGGAGSRTTAGAAAAAAAAPQASSSRGNAQSGRGRGN